MGIACQTRASSTSRSGRAARQTSTRSIDGPKRLAPSPIADPFTYPRRLGGYVSDPHGFSVEILRTTPGLADRIFGFEPRPLHKRPDTDTRRIEHRINDQRTGRQSVGRNHRSRQHGRWIGFDPVTVRKEGWTRRHGAGSGTR